MKYYFRNMTEKYRREVIDIFNYYIENTDNAFLETKMSYDFFDIFLKYSSGYPAIVVSDAAGTTIGFSYLRPYNPIKAFRRTAEITYFILPQYTRKGIGCSILDYMAEEAKKMGIDSFLAGISSLNRASIDFHIKNGFKECGRFERIGTKFGREFDLIWMQKKL